MLRYIKYGVAILVIGLVVHATNLWVGLPLMAKLWSFLVAYRDEVRIALISTAVIILVLTLFMGGELVPVSVPFRCLDIGV